MGKLPSVLLIGLRGSGKTTLGRELAQRLHRTFVDLDDETKAQLRCPTISQAWEKHGESGFRQAEVRALKRVLSKPGQVIALGGGTPTGPGAREAIERAQLNKTAYVIYLRAGAQTLRERLVGCDLADRPSLTGTDSIAEIDLVLARRDSLYRTLADEVIDVDGVDMRTTLRELVSLF